MLTLPDLKSKQILFIETENGVKNHLFFKNENIVFQKDDKIVNQASSHRLLAVFVIGNFTLTSGLLRECRKRGVSLFFLGDNFRTYGALNFKADGNYLLRSMQYQMSPQTELYIAKNIVINKIKNQINLLKSVDKKINQEFIEEAFVSINKAYDSKSLLGSEGNFTKLFFKNYFGDIGWWRRLPRVKPDIPNFLLDIGYTLLFNFIDSLLLLFGFDTYKGCYHKLFFQRKSLTCDIIEPFRCIIEKQILKSYHLKQINEKDFFVKQGRYWLAYKKSAKYSRFFMEAIMSNKEPIYLYIQRFYRFVMKNGETNFPEFDVLNCQVK